MKTQATIQRAMPASRSANWNIICDFDGTITPFDVTDAILERFAPPEWERIEEEWVQGTISSRECLTRQFALLSMPLTELDDFLDTIPITPGVEEFVSYCGSSGLSFAVVSDGMDYVIRRILARHGLDSVPVIANRLLYGVSGYRVEFPFRGDGCMSGVCKCNVAMSLGSKFLLVGDGKSDCCVAGVAAYVLARQGKSLERECQKNSYPFNIYTDFFEVRHTVEALLTQSSLKSSFEQVC